MKIAFLIQDITTQGGTERTTISLANQFARHGHNTAVISVFHMNAKPQYPVDDDIKTDYISDTPYSLELSAWQRLRAVIAQTNKVRKNKFLQEADVIISQKTVASTMALLAGYRKKTIACEHFRYAMYTPALRRMRNRLYGKLLHLVVLTEADQQQFQRYIGNVSVIPNMIPIALHENSGCDAKTIISVGRLTPQKGYDLLLDALNMIKPSLNGWKVHIWGDGELHKELQGKINTLGLDHIVRLCGVTHNIEQEYANATFYVMSSRFEGFPMALLEAAACQLPIVSFDCPEGPAILLKNGGGLIARREDTTDLATKIETLTTDIDLRRTLSAQSHGIITPYLPENIYKHWLDLFSKLNING